MEKYINILKKCPLFKGIEEDNIVALLSCLNAQAREYDRNEFIFIAGERTKYIGIVLRGAVHILREDYMGERTVLTNIERGELFGEAFSCAEVDSIPVSVLAAKKSKILLIDYKRIITSCSAACTFHKGLIKNMIKILAQKNIMLTQKIDIITKKTTREKLLAYLFEHARKSGKSNFTIPFDRQELADFLAVERSAMSAEISRMQHDGIIKTNRSFFELLI